MSHHVYAAGFGGEDGRGEEKSHANASAAATCCVYVYMLGYQSRLARSASLLSLLVPSAPVVLISKQVSLRHPPPAPAGGRVFVVRPRPPFPAAAVTQNRDAPARDKTSPAGCAAATKMAARGGGGGQHQRRQQQTTTQVQSQIRIMTAPASPAPAPRLSSLSLVVAPPHRTAWDGHAAERRRAWRPLCLPPPAPPPRRLPLPRLVSSLVAQPPTPSVRCMRARGHNNGRKPKSTQMKQKNQKH